MTTFTSNNNQFAGKTFTSKNNRENLDYSERSGCGGYVLLGVLIAVAVVIFYFISTQI